MRLMAALRYRVIPVDDLAQHLREFRLPPRRSAVITIDDGYVDNLEIADPILRRARFPATIFLVSDLLGQDNNWAQDPTLRGRPLMSADRAVRARNGVLRFGVHTRTHASLPKVSDDQVREEVAGSRADLERALGIATPTFAYPFGDYDERSLAAVRQAGFTAALTTDPRRVRPDDDPALIPRIEIARSDSLPRFLVKLWFGVG
jgi:peptidoglycan/xylan/chitin deacetylase (PgdA/CDA1 family)